MTNARALILFLGLACSLALGAEARVERISISGKEYQRLDQWARANSFQWKWVSKNDVQVWNGATRMQFSTDSKRLLLNGITVLLSEAVVAQNGTPCVASVDLTSAIQPVLFPPRNRPRAGVKHVCLDAGHGGSDPGNREGREQEKKYALLLAQEVGAQLVKAGFTVSYTRSGDTFIDLPVRPDLARRQGADLFISLHFNAAGAGGSGVQGAETYCMTPVRASSTNARGEGASNRAFTGNLNNARNMLLAYEIQRAMVRAGSEDRGVKRARFAVLRDATMPAVLVEAGFMTSPAEARNIYSAAWRKKTAQAIAGGITSYRKLVGP